MSRLELLCHIREDTDRWHGYMPRLCYSYHSLNDMPDRRYVIHNLYVREHFTENRIQLNTVLFCDIHKI